MNDYVCIINLQLYLKGIAVFGFSIIQHILRISRMCLWKRCVL